MLQPSLLSGPERFALGGGRSGSLIFVLSVSYVSQQCAVHVVFHLLLTADIA
jgi:hypothetical protein